MRPLLQIATVHTLKRRKRKWAPEKPTCWLCKTYVSHAVSFTKRFYNGVCCKSSSFLLSSLFNFFSFLISFLNWCKYFIRLYESFVRFHALIFELYICLNFMHIYYIFELYNVCVCLFVLCLFGSTGYPNLIKNQENQTLMQFRPWNSPTKRTLCVEHAVLLRFSYVIPWSFIYSLSF